MDRITARERENRKNRAEHLKNCRENERDFISLLLLLLVVDCILLYPVAKCNEIAAAFQIDCFAFSQ